MEEVLIRKLKGCLKSVSVAVPPTLSTWYQEQHAPMPLYRFCVNDLPIHTRASELDGRSTIKILKDDAEHWTRIGDGSGYDIGREGVGKYLQYLGKAKLIR